MHERVNEFPWERSFVNLDINNKVYLFNQIIKIMLSDFIPHETITIDDRYPPWINCKIKHLINEKNAAYNNYLKITKQSIFCNVSVLSESIKFIDCQFEK